MRVKLIALAVSLVFLAGCSQDPDRVTFDATDDATTHASLMAMMKGMEPGRAEAFLRKSRVAAFALGGPAPIVGASDSASHRTLHGMTRADIERVADREIRKMKETYDLPDPPGMKVR